MSQNVTGVFRATVPSVGLVLKARADIDGKQNAYRRRIAEDAEGDESAALTEYSANVDSREAMRKRICRLSPTGMRPPAPKQTREVVGVKSFDLLKRGQKEQERCRI